MIQDIVGYEIFTGVLTYRDNLSVVWKTMLSVFLLLLLLLFFFLRLFFFFQRIDFCDIQPILWMHLSTYWITVVLIFLVVSALRLAVLPFRVHLCG